MMDSYALAAPRRNPTVGLLVVPGVVLVGGLAASAYLYWRLYQKKSDDVHEAEEPAPSTSAPPGASPVPGVRLSSSRVLMNGQLWDFLAKLRSIVDFDLIITSGTRDAAGQARAMNTNYMNNGGPTGGGRAYLVDLYGSDYGNRSADALETGGVNALAAYVQWRIDNGLAGSGHLAGRGLDFGINHLTVAQQERLMAAGRELGAEIEDERAKANHIHMQGIGTVAAKVTEVLQEGGKKARENIIPLVIATSVGVALIGGSAYLAYRRVR